MNIFYKVTLKTLLKNRTRTIVTIIGIILSASMITAVTTLISSLQNYMLNVVIYDSGDWHGCFYAADSTKSEEMKNDRERITQVSQLQDIGYALLSDSVNDYKPYLFVAGADETFFQTMPVHISYGRLPENASEIILPQHLATNGGIVFKTGDTLSLHLGQRTLDGMVLRQYNEFQSGESGAREVFSENETRTYTVVGFYNRPSFEPYSSPGYTAITIADPEATEYPVDIYFKMRNPKDTYNYLSESSEYGGTDNRNLLLYSGVSKYGNFYAVLYSLASILILLIMFGSVSLIYNAFSISVSERTRQFGLLSSIGATKKQMRSIVFYEALWVGALGIPLGILAGIAGIGVTLAFVGDAFASLYNGDIPFGLSLHVNVISVVSAAVLALITVLVSAWIPSRRATRVTAIEAVRQTRDIRLKDKKVKTSPLIYSLFGLEGMLARKYFKRSRKKYRATVLSLFMSVVLFVSASSFCGYVKDSISSVFETRPYDILYRTSIDKLSDLEPAELYRLLRDTPGVTQSSYSYIQSGHITIDDRYLSDEYKKYRENNNDIFAMCFVVDDETYLRFLEDNNMDPGLFMNKENPCGIALSFYSKFNFKTERYEHYPVYSGDRAELSLTILNLEKLNALPDEEIEAHLNDEAYYFIVPLRIEAILDSLPAGISGNEYGVDFTIMYPESLSETISAHLKGSSVDYIFVAKNHKKVYDEMASVLMSYGLDNISLLDYTADSEIYRNMIVIIDVFSYGFIVLISLIAAANVFNTISTNIALRRCEFAMLKSVGMTRKGFSKMMNYECLMYGVKSLFWGLPVSFFMTYLIYRSINVGFTGEFRLPWMAVGIAVFSVFAVVFSTMIYSMSKINKDNLIDAIRNENL